MSKKQSPTAKFLVFAFLALLLLQGQILLWGQEQKPQGSGVPLESLLLLGKRLVTGLIVLTILLILYTAFLRRPPFPEVTSKWLLLIGLVFLPAPLMFLGNVVGMERAKQVEACNSCHVMHPFGNDLKNPESKTLAAKHYKYRWIVENQCYGCHVDYSMVGLVEGKMDGLRHASKYYTHTYQLPIQYHSGRVYNAGICLHCHGESMKFIEQHVGATATPAEVATWMATEGKPKCIECHRDQTPIHPPRSERSHE